MTWRAIVGAVASVLAGVLALLSVVSGWVQTMTTDTDRVVALFAPLAQAPAVQELLNAQLTDAISRPLPLGDTEVVRGLVGRTVAGFTSSELFASAWTTSLRLSHAEVSALLRDEPGRVAVDGGLVQLRLAPFVEALKQPLRDAGVPMIDRLPDVTATIPLVQIDPNLVPRVQTAYRYLVALADVLPWLVLGCVLLALWAWPSLRRGLLWVGLSLLAGAAVLWAVLSVAGRTAAGLLADGLEPVANVVLSAALHPMREPALAIAVLGLGLTFLGAMIVTDPRKVG